MRGITIKLPEATLQRLSAEARASGRSIAAVVRDKIETQYDTHDRDSVYARAADLAGSVAGSSRAATNDRRKFSHR